MFAVAAFIGIAAASFRSASFAIRAAFRSEDDSRRRHPRHADRRGRHDGRRDRLVRQCFYNQRIVKVVPSQHLYLGGPDLTPNIIDQPRQNRGRSSCWDEWGWNAGAALWDGDVPQARAADDGVVVSNVSRTQNTFTIEVEATRPSRVLVNTTYDKQWRVDIGGTASLNSLLVIDVPEGHAVLHAQYLPRLFWPGVLLTLLGIAGTSALFVYVGRQRTRTKRLEHDDGDRGGTRRERRARARFVLRRVGGATGDVIGIREAVPHARSPRPVALRLFAHERDAIAPLRLPARDDALYRRMDREDRRQVLRSGKRGATPATAAASTQSTRNASSTRLSPSRPKTATPTARKASPRTRRTRGCSTSTRTTRRCDAARSRDTREGARTARAGAAAARAACRT